eukprot:SAG22_NODE_437_length_10501_cov_3.019804_3_plen_320_part_00
MTVRTHYSTIWPADGAFGAATAFARRVGVVAGGPRRAWCIPAATTNTYSTAVVKLPTRCPMAAATAQVWCIWAFFEETVKRSRLPGQNKIALSTDEGDETTFEALRDEAEELDGWMRALGVCGPGQRVMFVGKITPWALTAVLAVVRNGAVFIPNDEKDPAAYRAELIEMAGVSLVLCERPIPGLPAGVKVICTATDSPPSPVPAAAGGAGEPHSFDPADLAAIFFSSGSTGKPKGVQHSALIWFEFAGLCACCPALPACPACLPASPACLCLRALPASLPVLPASACVPCLPPCLQLAVGQPLHQPLHERLGSLPPSR